MFAADAMGAHIPLPFRADGHGGLHTALQEQCYNIFPQAHVKLTSSGSQASRAVGFAQYEL